MTNKITKVYKNWVEYDIYASWWAAGAWDVSWPWSSVDGDIAVYNWTTWKIIKDSWKKLSDYQTALSTQTAYTSKWTASKVPQITTNTLWQVTGITEVSITYPSQVSDTAYASSWNWVTTTAPSKNAVYDKIASMDTTISWKQDALVSWTNIKTINNESILGSWNITISWGVSMSTITVTLTAAGWSSNEQTVSATWVTASNTVIVSPAPSSIGDYADWGVYASAQGSGTLTFSCDEEPTSDITVNVLIMS